MCQVAIWLIGVIHNVSIETVNTIWLNNTNVLDDSNLALSNCTQCNKYELQVFY